jgi:hypothetical protein
MTTATAHIILKTRQGGSTTWHYLDRQKASYRQAMRPVFRRAFDHQIQPLYDRIMEISDIRDLEIPPLNNQAIEEAYRKLYMNTSIPFAMESRRKWGKMLSRRKAEEDEIFESLITEQILQYLKNNAGSMVVAAGDTSIALIQDLLKRLTPEILDQGLGMGEAQTMLRDRIASEWHEMKYYRTERIVRTEINRASNYGSLEGTKSLGVEMNKVWMSAFAKHTRDEHKAANGQKVDLHEAFTVWGERLQYPGDPAGRAENTINCLCGFYEELK